MRAKAVFQGSLKGSEIDFIQGPQYVTIKGKLQGLPPGKHGFHIHEFGHPNCSKAGSHFNPDGNPHGGLHDKLSHAGDLGNIRNGLVYLRTKKASLTGKRGIVLHEGEDDLGSSGDPTGHAGKRLDCAIIGWAAH
tara:strand:- start:983 stop:1387 length:405 start_codon:yes stop_codon:yes gene_type:complete